MRSKSYCRKAMESNGLYVLADAAVATSAALNVTEPSCCGIGGCGPMPPSFVIVEI